MVRVIWQKVRIAAAHGRLNRIRQGRHIAPLSNTYASLDPPESTSQMTSRSVWPFLHNGPPLVLSKLLVRIGRPGPPSNIWFLGPTWVHSPNDISIGSAVFCRAHDCNWPTDRQTDKPRYTPSVTIGRIYIHNTAMRRKKWSRFSADRAALWSGRPRPRRGLSDLCGCWNWRRLQWWGDEDDRSFSTTMCDRRWPSDVTI